MPDDFRQLLIRLAEGETLSQNQMEACFDHIMEGAASPTQMAAFVTALKRRGETPADIAAGASVLRRRAVTIKADDATIDIVGTGGDGVGTWNISSTAALVVAGAGIPVAKHGNRAVSSRSGAADVLTALGINLDCPMTSVQQALTEAGICFLMAPRHHSAMRHVGPVRAELGFRTIFNMLGPLSNPALVKRILVGVYDSRWLRPFAEALATLGTSHALIVHGSDGLDEVTTTGKTEAVMLRQGEITPMTLEPAMLGLPIAEPAALVGGTPEENAQALRGVLEGNTADATGRAYRDIVIFNAAAALFGSGHAETLGIAAEMAIASLDQGRAAAALENLIQITNQEQA